MTKTIIFAISAITTILILGTISFSGIVNAGGEGEPSFIIPQQIPVSKAIPDWVDNNFRWYGEGLIEQSDLLNSLSYLLDNGNIFLSDKAAQEVSDLRAENAQLRSEFKPVVEGTVLAGAVDSPVDEYGRVKVQFHWDEETEQEALHHLRKAYDLDPAFQTKVVQFDNNHDKWIDVLSIDWGSSSSQEDCSAVGSDENSSCWIRVSQVHAGEEIWTNEYGATSSSGDPDRPLITGQVYNSETTDDRPTEEVAFYYNKIASASETVHDLVNSGETSTTGWDEGVAAFTSKNYGTTSASDGVHELGHALGVFCNVAIDKEIHALQAEVSVLQDLSDMHIDDTTRATEYTRSTGDSTEEVDGVWWGERLFIVDQKIKSLQTGLDVCEAQSKNLDEYLQTLGDDAQLANIDLQNSLQKQQQTLQTMSNVSKMLHDTAMAIIRKIG